MNINANNEIVKNKVNQNNTNINNIKNDKNIINANQNIKNNNINNNNKNNNNKNNNNKNNNNKNLNTKEKVIDYDLLKKQQKLYYQLNLKNKNYHRFANYSYNNPYGFGVVNPPNANNYLVNNQPIYYNANLNGNNKINPQIFIPMEQGKIQNNILVNPNKNQILLNQQQNPQYQNPYGNQPQFINPNNKQQIPVLSKGYQQPQPAINQIPLNNQNMQIQKNVIIPNNNKDETEVSKITVFTDKTTVSKAIPKGSRMPKQIAQYFSSNTHQVNSEIPKQNQTNYNQNKNQQQIKQEIKQPNLEIKNVKGIQQLKNEFSNEKKFLNKTPTKQHNNNNAIQNLHRIKTNVETEPFKEPQNNPRHHKNDYNNNSNQPQKQFDNINENKYQNKDIEDNKNDYKNKDNNKIKENKYENEIEEKMKMEMKIIMKY